MLWVGWLTIDEGKNHVIVEVKYLRGSYIEYQNKRGHLPQRVIYKVSEQGGSSTSMGHI